MGGILHPLRRKWATVMMRRAFGAAACRRSDINRGSGAAHQLWGRRPLLLMGFATAAIAGVLFALVPIRICS